jgi:hypothetical protein
MCGQHRSAAGKHSTVTYKPDVHCDNYCTKSKFVNPRPCKPSPGHEQNDHDPVDREGHVVITLVAIIIVVAIAVLQKVADDILA